MNNKKRYSYWVAVAKCFIYLLAIPVGILLGVMEVAKKQK